MVTTYETVKIESKLFKTICEMAEKENTTENKIINQILKKGMETVQSENKNEFLEMGGIFTTDKPFSAVEDRKKMRNGEL
jgi:hypothetical protein